MNIQKERVVAPEVVLTEVAVYYARDTQWFAVRCRVRSSSLGSESYLDTLSFPLTRRQLEAESDGPELADFLVAHPGSWWRLPLSRSITEGRGV